MTRWCFCPAAIGEVFGEENRLGNCEGFTPSDWEWSCLNKSPEVILSQDKTTAYFYINNLQESTGTAGVRGSKGFFEGEHYWEVTFIEPPIGTSVMVGVGTERVCLHADNHQFVNLLGQDKESWGLSYKGKVWHDGESQEYCAPWYNETTVIGVYLDMYHGTLSFFLNGQPLGTAFKGLGSSHKMLYPLVSATTEGSEVCLGKRMSRYLTLQEKCFNTIARSLKCSSDIETLPLPVFIKKHLHIIS